MTASKPVILVDGSSYLFRAFHALPPLSTSEGEPTGALYGVVNMLRKLLEDYQPEHIAVVFDARGKTFRDELFEAYKANRPPMPEELARQIEPVHAVVRAMGLPVLEVAGVEADDVIGTLARHASARGMEVLISTGDKDMAQLVDGHVTLLDTMPRGDGRVKVTDEEEVKARFGVPPERIVDLLALMGDSADNIPGIPGVGPKTAARWLQEFGCLDAVIERAGEIKGKVGEKLRAHLDALPLSRELATLRCDLDIGVDVDALRRSPPDTTALGELFARYEFRTWLRQLQGETPAPSGVGTASDPTARYELVMEWDALERWLERLADAAIFAFDTETTSLDYMEARVVGVSFAVRSGEAAYVPLGHDYAGAPEQLSCAEVLRRLAPLLEDPERAKLGQNLKYDASVLANHGIELQGIRHDTMLESYVLDSTATRHDLDSLAAKYLDIATVRYEDVAGKGTRQLSFNEVPVDTAGPYAAEDADVALRLHRALWPRLEAEPALRALYEEIEVPLVPVLSRMERTGVLVDAGLLRRHSTEIARRMVALEAKAHRLAGQPFNLGSPKQLQQILFDELGLPVVRRTPKGQPSTAEEVLQELAPDYPLPRVILEHRSLSKLRSTYTDRLPEQVNARTGRVHTSYHQAVASTGRLSSSDPNLQNIPVRTEEGRRIRQAFIAPPGYRILAADYSQIELRIMAHLSGDPGLLRAFARGEDIHRATAAELFGVPVELVGPEQRRSAKAINFGLIYGMSAFGLARQLGIPRPDAQDYVERYFARYPGVRTFMDATREQAAEKGYVETVYGRRLYLAEIRARNGQRRQAAERTAINAPMQGTAADIIKRAMLGVDHGIQEGALPARMIMQVHDELVFEVAAEAVEAATAMIRERMVAAAALAVPLEVDVGVGANWDQAH